MAGIQAFVLANFLYFGRFHIAEIYTNIPELQVEFARMNEFFAFYHLVDGFKSVSCGAMRGLARQGEGSVISGIAYYVISIPLMYLFAFYMEKGLIGLWIAQLVASFFHVGAILYLVYFKYDWDQIGQEAYERVEKEKVK